MGHCGSGCDSGDVWGGRLLSGSVAREMGKGNRRRLSSEGHCNVRIDLHTGAGEADSEKKSQGVNETVSLKSKVTPGRMARINRASGTGSFFFFTGTWGTPRQPSFVSSLFLFATMLTQKTKDHRGNAPQVSNLRKSLRVPGDGAACASSV